jgi:PD-(D/E)XK nuclease superfamily
MTTPLRVSNSGLGTVAHCYLKAFLRYGCRVIMPERAAPLLVGQIGHETLAMHFAGKDQAACQAHFAARYDELEIEQLCANEPHLALSNISLILSEYLRLHQLDRLPFVVDPEHIETRFELPLDTVAEGDAPRFIFNGIIDLLVQDKVSEIVYITDHKFRGGKITDWWLKKFKLDSQIDGYLFAARRVLRNSAAVSGFYVNAIELGLLPGSQKDAKCKKHGVMYSECRRFHSNFQLFSVNRTEQSIIEWRKVALFWANRMAELLTTYGEDKAAIPYIRQTGRFNGSCTFCDYAEFCAAGCPLEWVGTRYVRDPRFEVVLNEEGGD